MRTWKYAGKRRAPHSPRVLAQPFQLQDPDSPDALELNQVWAHWNCSLILFIDSRRSCNPSSVNFVLHRRDKLQRRKKHSELLPSWLCCPHLKQEQEG
jgi:hypothetical protein